VRKRLLWSSLVAVGVALVLLGLPLAVAVRSSLERSTFDRLEGEVEQARIFLDSEASSLQRAAAILEFLAERSGERFTLLDLSGRVVADTGDDPVPAGTMAISPDVERARQQGEAAYHHGSGSIAASVPIQLSGSSLLLRVADSDVELAAAIRRSWLSIAGLGLSALLAGVMLALYQGRRLAAPLEDLAASARRLGDGDFSARAPRSGLPEPDDVAAALDSTAGRLSTMLERSHSFSADASHQLRTPLTALRLDLEALAMSGAEPELVAAATAEADRLEATIAELLTLAQPPSEEAVDVARLTASRLDAWRALARAEGREVLLDAGPVAAVRARAAALGQCLQVLLDNALAHGSGTITVSIRHVPGPGVRLCVADEGSGFTERAVPRPADRHGGHHGRGLPLARSLIEAEGGRLHIEQLDTGARVCLLLPGVGGRAGDTADVRPAAASRSQALPPSAT
jgi:signal transduction histidine kinase